MPCHAAAPANGAASRGRPNVVFILIDDMGWPDPACYGHEFHETPQIVAQLSCCLIAAFRVFFNGLEDDSLKVSRDSTIS